MKKKDIYELVEKRKNELKNAQNEIKDYSFIKEFLKNNHIRTLSDFLQIDIWTCIKCLYFIKMDEKKPLEECCKIIDSFTYFFDIFLTDSLNTFLLYIDTLDDEKILFLAQYLLEDNYVNKKKLLKKISGTDDIMYKNLKITKEAAQKVNVDLSSFSKMLASNRNLVEELLFLYYTYRYTHSTKEIFYENINIANQQLSNKKKISLLNKHLSDKVDSTYIFEQINKISSFISTKERIKKEKNKNISFELQELDFMIILLEKASKMEEITNASSIIRHIQDPKIRLAVLKYIDEYNRPYHSKLKHKLKKLEENQDSHYKALMHNYKLDKIPYNIEKIKRHTVKEVKEMLEILIQNNFTDEVKVYALETSDILTIKNIFELISKGYLTKKFTEEKKEIFDITQDYLTTFLLNLDILVSYSVNPLYFLDSLDVLLEDSYIIKKNIELCLEYSLLANFKNFKDYHFLLSQDLDKKIDRIIEMGYKDYLSQNLELLNSSNINRLEVLHALKIKQETMEKINSILDEHKRFFIQDSEIDSYIPNILEVKHEIDLESVELSKYQISDLEYSISGIIISKQKVRRLLNQGYSVYNALFYGMKLSNEDYEIMINTIKKDMDEKKKIIKI